MKNYAVKLGVPSDKIITEINSRDTVGDAFFKWIGDVIEFAQTRMKLVLA